MKRPTTPAHENMWLGLNHIAHGLILVLSLGQLYSNLPHRAVMAMARRHLRQA